MKEELLETIIREMEAGVLVLDRSKRVLFINPAFEGTLRQGPINPGMPVTSFLNDHDLLKAIDDTLDTQISRKVTIQWENEQSMEIRFIPFKEPVSGLIGFFRDVTEEKRVEAIKRDFVANVSHELRTPLATIKGYSETLLAGAMDDRKVLEDFLRIIDKHASRMTNLIEDLLTLSMLESQQIPLRLEYTDMRDILKNVVQGFERRAQDKGLDLSYHSDPGLPRTQVDRVRMEQVFVNLIDNAIKYTNEGKIFISALREGAYIKIKVEDTGIGIPEKDIPRIFERFYRVDKGRSRELGGTGLGLAIVKHIIQAHNGRIEVHSKVGQGSTFTILLPLIGSH